MGMRMADPRTRWQFASNYDFPITSTFSVSISTRQFFPPRNHLTVN